MEAVCTGNVNDERDNEKWLRQHNGREARGAKLRIHGTVSWVRHERGERRHGKRMSRRGEKRHTERGIEERRRREVAIYASEPCLVSSSSERAVSWMRLLGRVVERWESLREGKSNAREKGHPRGPPACDVTADKD